MSQKLQFNSFLIEEDLLFCLLFSFLLFFLILLSLSHTVL